MNKIKIASVMLWIVLLAVIPVQATGNLATDIEQQLRASYLNDGSEYVVTIPNFVTTLPSE